MPSHRDMSARPYPVSRFVGGRRGDVADDNLRASCGELLGKGPADAGPAARDDARTSLDPHVRRRHLDRHLRDLIAAEAALLREVGQLDA